MLKIRAIVIIQQLHSKIFQTQQIPDFFQVVRLQRFSPIRFPSDPSIASDDLFVASGAEKQVAQTNGTRPNLSLWNNIIPFCVLINYLANASTGDKIVGFRFKAKKARKISTSSQFTSIDICRDDLCKSKKHYSLHYALTGMCRGHNDPKSSQVKNYYKNLSIMLRKNCFYLGCIEKK